MWRWARLLVLAAVSGWRLPLVVVLLGAASWLATSDVVNTRSGTGWLFDAPANLLSTPNAIVLAVLPGFVLLTADLVPRVLRTGIGGYAAARLGDRGRWWLGIVVAVAVLAVAYTVLTLAVSLAVGLLRLGVTPGDPVAREAMLAEIDLQPWLTQPSPAAASALVLPLFGALVVLGVVPALTSLWTRSAVAVAAPAVAWLALTLSWGSFLRQAPVLDVVAAANAAAYRDARLTGGTLVEGRSLLLAVAVAAGWAVLITAAGWWRVRRNGIPLR